MPKIIIDEEKCKNCGICMEFCPNKLISKSDRVNETGIPYAVFRDTSNKCTGCAICAISCPEIAIKEVIR